MHWGYARPSWSISFRFGFTSDVRQAGFTRFSARCSHTAASHLSRPAGSRVAPGSAPPLFLHILVVGLLEVRAEGRPACQFAVSSKHVAALILDPLPAAVTDSIGQ
jgi:hypothetical protein